METAIRWSPTSTTAEQRFLQVDVTGKSFRLCRVTAFDGRNLDHEVLSTHTKVPAFRAFDWSPADESLIAVGQSSGDATILRLGNSSSSGDGGGDGGDVQETFSFPIRSQRHCNTVAFSSHGLLAAGLDRVRNDFCLNIWGVSQRLAMKGTKGFAEPLRKLASSEPITSIKFFRDQPDTLVAGVKGQYVRLYDLRGEFYQLLSFACFPDRVQRVLGTRLCSFRPGACIIWPLTGLMRITLHLVLRPMMLLFAFGIDVLALALLPLA